MPDDGLAAALRALQDERDIRQVLSRIAWLSDRRDEAAFNLWAPDAIYRLSDSIVRSGRAAIRDAAIRRWRNEGGDHMAPLADERHILSTAEIVLSGDTAVARSDYVALEAGPDGLRLRACGVYEDTLRRTFEGWWLTGRQIAHRLTAS